MFDPHQLHLTVQRLMAAAAAQVQVSAAAVEAESEPRRGCLQPGCPCRDPRIVSHRRAAFHAALARRVGETADRVIAPDPEWSLPTGDPA